MKKHTLLTALVALLMLVSFASCSMYTGNLYKKIDDSRVAKGKAPMFGDDISELLTKASAADIADAAADAGTQDEAKGALEALGKKDKEEIKKLNSEQKEDILDAQVLATLGGSDTTKALTDVISGNSGNIDVDDIMDALISSTAGVDTKATTTILNSALNVDPNDPNNSTVKTFTLDPSLDKSKVAMAAAAVAVSTLASADIDYMQLIEKGDDDSEIGDAMESLMYYINGGKDGSGQSITVSKTPKEIAEKILDGKPGVDTLATAIAALGAAGGLESLTNIAG